MTDIRELLREAAADVTAQRSDPVEQVRRAVTRRLRTAAAVGLAAIAVAAAIIVPISLSAGGGTKDAASLPHHAAVGVWAPRDGDVVAYAGSLWGLKCCSVQSGQSWVDKLDPNTGQLLARFQVSSPAFQIAAGAGRIWVTGFNPGGGGPSGVTAIDPTSGAWQSIDLGTRGEPHGIAFAAGSAWITQPLLQRVLRLTPPATNSIGPATGFGRASVAIGGGPETIATTNNGQLWVERALSGRLSRITPTKAGGRVTRTVEWSRPLYGAYRFRSLLTSGGHGVVTALTPQALTRCTACAQVNLLAAGHRHVFAAAQSARGLFVAASHRVYFESLFSLSRFSNGFPNATIEYGPGSSIAVDGLGAVIGTSHGLVHWVPPDTGTNVGHPAG